MCNFNAKIQSKRRQVYLLQELHLFGIYSFNYKY